MPLDPEKVQLCREWLTIAASDADDAYRCASDTLRAVLSGLPTEVAP
jgi:hypothetical protein